MDLILLIGLITLEKNLLSYALGTPLHFIIFFHYKKCFEYIFNVIDWIVCVCVCD